MKETCMDNYASELEIWNMFVKISEYIHPVYFDWLKTSFCIIKLKYETTYASLTQNLDAFDIYSALLDQRKLHIRINSRKLHLIVMRMRTMNFDAHV